MKRITYKRLHISPCFQFKFDMHILKPIHYNMTLRYRTTYIYVYVFVFDGTASFMCDAQCPFQNEMYADYINTC